MISEYQMFAIGQMKWALVASLATSIGYLVAAEASRSRARLLMALPGLVVLLAVAFAVIMSPWTDSHSTLGALVFLTFTGLLVLALAMDFAAMYAVENPTVVDVLQFLLLPSVPWIWFVGGMVIGHDWL